MRTNMIDDDAIAKYTQFAKDVSTLPDDEQIEVGREIYETVWEAMRDSAGQNRASCVATIKTMSDPYWFADHLLEITRHTSRRAASPIIAMKASVIPNEQTVMFAVTVSTSIEDATLVADAALMTCVLRCPGLPPELPRMSWAEPDIAI